MLVASASCRCPEGIGALGVAVEATARKAREVATHRLIWSIFVEEIHTIYIYAARTNIYAACTDSPISRNLS